MMRHPGCPAAGTGSCPSTGRHLTCRTARRTTSTSAARRTRPGTGRSRRSGGWRRRSPGPGAARGVPGPVPDSEQALARDLLETGCFGPGMVVLADRKFLSWALAREFLAAGAHILWRASASFTLKPVKVLADGTYLAELKPPRTQDGPPLRVRVIEYTVHTAPAGGDGGDEQTSSCSAWSPICSTRRSTRPWTSRAATRGGGDARPSSATTRPTWATGSRSCVARTRPRRAGDVGAVRRLPGHMQDHRDRGSCRGRAPGTISFPHALQAATDTVAAFSP